MGPQLAQDAPKMPQDVSRKGQNGSKMTQNGPKHIPLTNDNRTHIISKTGSAVWREPLESAAPGGAHGV